MLLESEGQLAVHCQWGAIAHILLRQAVQVKRNRVEWGMSLIEPGEVEEIFDQACQAICLALQILGKLSRVLRLFFEHIVVKLDTRQRGAQFMGNIGEKLIFETA